VGLQFAEAGGIGDEPKLTRIARRKFLEPVVWQPTAPADLQGGPISESVDESQRGFEPGRISDNPGVKSSPGADVRQQGSS
jgi:hypothetical protein